MDLVKMDTYWFIPSRHADGYDITIEQRPFYCDRGRFIATAFPVGRAVMEFDDQDGWPRYYFDWDRMLLEIEEWLKIRDRRSAND